jgi:Tfp pilus tip-associated adhesin PilY1
MQEILAEETGALGRVLRKTSNTDVTYTGADPKLGWYMNMGYGSNVGERIVKKSVLSLGWLLFSTVVPKDDRCESGGDSWFFMLDPLTGQRPGITAIDINRNGTFDTGDALSDGTTAPSAAKSQIGILSAPLVVSFDTGASWDAFSEMIGGSGESGAVSSSDEGSSFSSGSSGKVGSDLLRGNGLPPGPPVSPPPGVNRVFWMQIQ